MILSCFQARTKFVMIVCDLKILKTSLILQCCAFVNTQFETVLMKRVTEGIIQNKLFIEIIRAVLWGGLLRQKIV